MSEYFLLLALLIIATLCCTLGFERTMGLSVDYWKNRQYKLFKTICATIGVCFLVAIIVLTILSAERFSQGMNKVVFILVVSAFLSMALFSIVINIIAWKKKQDILIADIKNFVESELQTNAVTNKEELLESYLADYRNEYIFDNKLYYSQKQIKWCFEKVTKQVELHDK